jgi:hypothetical protein
MKFAVGCADPSMGTCQHPGQCLAEILAALAIAPVPHFCLAEYHLQPPG